MERPKDFLFAVLLLSVAAVALAAVAIHATRAHQAGTPPASATAAGRRLSSPSSMSGVATPGGTPSVAAQKRAKEFNDATSRFNAPDDQSQ